MFQNCLKFWLELYRLDSSGGKPRLLEAWICQTGLYQLGQKPRGRGGSGRECLEISNDRPISITCEIISYLYKEQDKKSSRSASAQFYKVSDRQTYKANTRGPGGPINDTGSFW